MERADLAVYASRTTAGGGVVYTREVEETSLQAQDQRLVEAAQKDIAAFSALYERYVLPVYRYFYRRLGNTHDAEDLTSSTFSKALASLAGYKGRGSFAAWLFGIARYTLLDHQRARRPQTDIDLVVPSLTDPDPQPDAAYLQAADLAHLDRLVRELPDDQREVVLLRLFAELSTRDVAAVMGRSEAAIKMLLHRAVTTLRARYTEEAQ